MDQIVKYWKHERNEDDDIYSYNRCKQKNNREELFGAKIINKHILG